MLPDGMKVKEARDRYLDENGFSLEEYRAPWFKVSVLGVTVPLPNPPSRRALVPLHDLHHVATGYDTDWVGEGEIGAWELGAGCTTFASYFLNGGAAAIGLVLAPRRVAAAFRRGRASRTLYRKPPPDDLLDRTLGELRRHLDLVP